MVIKILRKINSFSIPLVIDLDVEVKTSLSKLKSLQMVVKLVLIRLEI